MKEQLLLTCQSYVLLSDGELLLLNKIDSHAQKDELCQNISHARQEFIAFDKIEVLVTNNEVLINRYTT